MFPKNTNAKKSAAMPYCSFSSACDMGSKRLCLILSGHAPYS